MTQKVHISYEYQDGTTINPTRLFAVDRLRASQIARNRNLAWEDNPTIQGLIAFALAQRLGLPSTQDFDTWIDAIADYEFSNAEVNPTTLDNQEPQNMP